MKGGSGPRLAIFDTFKTKSSLTGEAGRQRRIISILAGGDNPAKRTKTGIAQEIASGQGASWKNVYSGIFKDLDEVLGPMGIVGEQGRLPLKRGPRALQEKGIPYYHLTKRGILVALGIDRMPAKEALLGEFFGMAEPAEREFEGAIMGLQKQSPNFTYSIFQRYVKAFCDGMISDLLPFDLSRLSKIPDESLLIQREMLAAFMKMPKQERQQAMRLIDIMVPWQAGAKPAAS